MTITIEVDGKRVECGSEKEARKALAKAAREQRKVDECRQDKQDRAHMKAKAMAFHLLESAQSIAEGGTRSWTVATAESTTDYQRRLWAKWSVDSNGYAVVPVETDTGPGQLKFYGSRPTTILQNGAGWEHAVQIVDETTHDLEWVTFGVCEGELSTVFIRGALAAQLTTMAITLQSRREQAAA